MLLGVLKLTFKWSWSYHRTASVSRSELDTDLSLSVHVYVMNLMPVALDSKEVSPRRHFGEPPRQP